MKKNVIAERIQKLLNDFKIESLADAALPCFSQVDAAILKVAMVVAALDGQVTDAELKAFEKLARKCRGYNAKSSKTLFREGLRVAGYIELAARTLSMKELLSVIEDEFDGLLPEGFVVGDARDVRRAFVMWVAMAMSDGDYSEIERRAIALFAARTLGFISVRRRAKARRQSLSPMFAAAFRETNLTDVTLGPDFFERAESLIAKLNREAVSLAAARELKALIVNG